MGFEKFEDVRDFAIRKEEEAIKLYLHAQYMTKHSSSQKMFEELATMEKGHKRRLQEMEVENVAESEIEDVPDLKISDYLVEVDFSPDLSYQEILTLAMKREESSIKLYTNMKKKFGNPNLNKLLDKLIREEKKHKLRLEKEYDERILTEM